MPPTSRSLQQWLITLVAASILPLLAFGSGLIWLDYTQGRKAAVAAMQATSRALMQAVDAELLARIGLLRALSESGAA
jgi:hypothetical protein